MRNTSVFLPLWEKEIKRGGLVMRDSKLSLIYFGIT